MKRHETISTLGVALAEVMTSTDLRRLAALIQKNLPTKKAELAAAIAKHLSDGRLRTVWQDLDELQRAAVAEVVHSNSPHFPADRFKAKYGQSPCWSIADQRGQHRPSALNFFFYGNGVMPDDLKEKLGSFVPRPAATRIETLAELPAAYDHVDSYWNEKTKTIEKSIESVPLVVRASERPVQRELLSILRLIDAGKVPVSEKTLRPTPAAIEAIANILEGGDYYPRLPAKGRGQDESAGPIRAFAWPLLVQAGGLAQCSGSKLALTKAGRAALSQPVAETIRTLWSQWVDSTVLDELSRIECVKGQTGNGKRGLTALPGRRGAIAGALAECPAGAWIAIDEFCRFLRASEHDLQVTHDPWSLYICELKYGALGYDSGVRILNERYLLAFLLEYTATLGLLDVALIPPADARPDYGGLWGAEDFNYFSRYDGLMYFRITPLGAYCLGRESTYHPPRVESSPVLRVLPNLEVVVEAPLEQYDRLVLDACAVEVSDVVWRLDPGKLIAVVETGQSLGDIREFLISRSDSAIPETVARMFEDIETRSTQVRDQGLARLIECADAKLAALIGNDPRIRKHCMCAGERHLVVPASSEAAFKRTLREMGYGLIIADAAEVESVQWEMRGVGRAALNEPPETEHLRKRELREAKAKATRRWVAKSR